MPTRRGEGMRLASRRLTGSSFGIWTRVSSTLSVRRLVGRGWCVFRSDRVRTTHPRPGERHLLTAPAPSKAIRGVLEKFADLPHEAEAEIRGLDEARRRIAELERQIRKARNTNSPQQLDRVAIERAVKVAVEREQAAWRQKLEQGRARFRQMSRRWPRQGEPSTK